MPPMRHTTLLLPFALPPAEHAKDLLGALDAPALAMLLARAQAGRHIDGDPFAAALPHETLLAGMNAGPVADAGATNSPPLAHALMQALGLPAEDGYWFVLQPAHFHIARDHLVLTDLRQLAIDEASSRTLFDATKSLFDELGHDVRYGNARYWFLRADTWQTLRTCTPDAATGHNIDVWMPRGEEERGWRRLHNEVQMLWHMHPINEQREARGQRRVNALWLWGGASAGDTSPHHYLRALTQRAGAVTAGDSLVDDTLVDNVLVDGSLTGIALAGDWGGWLSALRAIDARYGVPLLAALKSGTLSRVTLQLTDAQRTREWHASRNDMRKFWRKPSLSRLAD